MFATTGALAPQRSAPQRHSQPKDVACDSWAKGCYECLRQRVKSQVYLNFYQRAQPRLAEGNVCRWQGFSFFWPPKEHERTTWRKCKWTIKVEDCRRISKWKEAYHKVQAEKPRQNFEKTVIKSCKSLSEYNLRTVQHVLHPSVYDETGKKRSK